MQVDKAHKQTDAILHQLENKLKRVYQSSYNELKTKMASIMNKMELSKDLTPQQRYNLACKYDRLSKLEAEMVEGLRNATKEAVKMINDEMVNVYQINSNYEIDRLGVGSSFSKQAVKGVLNKEVVPFQKLAINNLQNAELIRSNLSRELLNGIMQGDSITNMSYRFKDIVQRNLKDCIRIARTETTRVESHARWSVGKQAEKAGLKVVKEWIATSDHRTRDAHMEANGQRVGMDEPFIVGGEELMYPGDPNGSPENVINCRCTVIPVVLDVNK